MRGQLDFFPPRVWLQQVTADTLRADALAALTSAIMALPQAIAFAAIAGLPIQYGFYTAIVTPVIAALLGSSNYMVSGPTTPISVLVFGCLAGDFEPGSEEFIQAAISLTFLAGFIQLLLGFLRLGSVTNFVSPAVMTGFTAGAAIIIFVSQLPSALGFSITDATSTIESFVLLVAQLNQTNLHALTLAATSFVTAVLTAYFAPSLPSYLLALATGTLAGFIINGQAHGVTYVQNVSDVIPTYSLPNFSQISLIDLAQSAFALALVGLLEATAIARSLASRAGEQVNINQEFIGQGASNTLGSFFSTYMGSGSFTRSAMNYDAGAKTPLAAILGSLFLLLILLFVSDWITFIPIPAIAGIIVFVGFRLIEGHRIKYILKTSRPSSAVMSITLFATLIIGLEFGIVTGIFFSLALYLRRSANTYLAIIAPDPKSDGRYFRHAKAFHLDECPQLAFARPDGELYFGSLDVMRDQLFKLETQRPEQTHLVMLMKGIPGIDMSGAQLIIEESERRKMRGGRLYITARPRQREGLFKRYGIVDALGTDTIFPNKGEAIASIIPTLDLNKCSACSNRNFRECPGATNHIQN